MRVFITGGSGFVGLSIARAVSEAGGAAILFADRPPPDELRRAAGVAETDVHIGDVRSLEEVETAVLASRCSHAVHAAALTPGPGAGLQHAPRVMDINVGGVGVVMQALAGRVERVVHLSSIAVYGGADASEGPLAETRPLSPVGLYGVSKVAGELMTREAIRQTGLDVTLLRLGPVFGPFEHETGLRELMSPHLQMLRLARAGVPAALPGRLAADWIYSADVGASVVERLKASDASGAVYNLGGGVVTDLAQWGELVAAHHRGWTWRLAAGDEQPNVVYHFTSDRAPMDTSRIAAAGGAIRFDLAAAAQHYFAWRNQRPSIN